MAASTDTAPVSGRSVRQLLTELSELEDRLRVCAPVDRPALQIRERRIVEELRSTTVGEP